MTAEREVLAAYRENRWHRNGSWYSRIDLPTIIDVQFVNQSGDASRRLGPYPIFSLVDGVAYAVSHVFAFCDVQNGDWYSTDLGKHWKRMILLPAVS